MLTLPLLFTLLLIVAFTLSITSRVRINAGHVVCNVAADLSVLAMASHDDSNEAPTGGRGTYQEPDRGSYDVPTIHYSNDGPIACLPHSKALPATSSFSTPLDKVANDIELHNTLTGKVGVYPRFNGLSPDIARLDRELIPIGG